MVKQELIRELKHLIPRMRRFAAGLAGSTDGGDELVQAACERLLRHSVGLRSETRLDSWLYKVIRNLHIDAIRAQSVRDRNAEELRHVTSLRPVDRDPMDSHLRLREVDQAMAALSEEHRSVLMLICVEGLSYKETAEVLQLPMGTVTSRLVRARQALMERLDQQSAGVDLGASG